MSSSPKKSTKTAAKASHPTYAAMVKASIKGLKERNGSSKAAILKYIVQNYKVGGNVKAINAHLRAALKRGVTGGSFKQVKGVGASGSFRLGEKAEKKVVKKTSPKKKVVKKTSPKKSTKSPAKKSTSPVKKAKSPAKKTKSPVKKTKSVVKKTKSPKKVKSPKKATKSPKKAKSPASKAKRSPKKAVKA